MATPWPGGPGELAEFPDRVFFIVKFTQQINIFRYFFEETRARIDLKAAFLHFEHCRATPKGGQDLAPGEGEWPRLQK